uniref:Uncharacterized protein n=1 Tax=Timema tahoe TaxID=61484 RepID=A0A7R9ICW7_9NEOP|nr:unnamed protein product [Timema tahoe]
MWVHVARQGSQYILSWEGLCYGTRLEEYKSRTIEAWRDVLLELHQDFENIRQVKEVPLHFMAPYSGRLHFHLLHSGQTLQTCILADVFFFAALLGSLLWSSSLSSSSLWSNSPDCILADVFFSAVFWSRSYDELLADAISLVFLLAASLGCSMSSLPTMPLPVDVTMVSEDSSLERTFFITRKYSIFPRFRIEPVPCGRSTRGVMIQLPKTHRGNEVDRLVVTSVYLVPPFDLCRQLLYFSIPGIFVIIFWAPRAFCMLRH